MQEIMPKYNISIHALVKRATNVIMDFPELQNISIHALVKRATIERLNELFKDDISIHALVKRATRIRTRFYLKHGFQSTPS